MIELLQLNDELLVRYRAAMMATVKMLTGQLKAIESDLRRLNRAIETAAPEKRQRLVALVGELQSNRAEVEESLLFHTSGP